MSDDETANGVEQHDGSSDATAKIFTRKKNIRRGNRAYVTRVAGEVDDSLARMRVRGEDMTVMLLKNKATLTDKQLLLRQLDDEIMEFLSDEDEIIKEIEGTSDVQGKIHQSIISIDNGLKTTVIPSTLTPTGVQQPPLPTGVQ